MVCVAGFEPAAPRFQGEYSNQTELHTDGDLDGNRTRILLLDRQTLEPLSY